MRIARTVVKRLLAAIPVLLFLTAVVFALSKASGINPARAELGANASPAALAHLEKQLWLNRPVVIQYFHYLDRVFLHADLGTSTRTQQPVLSDLRSAVPATAELALFTLLLVVVLGLVLGVTSALAGRGSGTVRGTMITGASVPQFLLGIGGIYFFYGKLHVLPAVGQSSYPNAPQGPTGLLLIDTLIAGQPAMFFNAIEHLILPAFALAIIPAVAIGRVLRSSLIDNLGADYVRTARSKGLGEFVILVRHVLRNALTAPLAMGGLQFAGMIAGVVIVESVFAWPGIGEYTAEAIPVNDFPAIAGVTLVVGIAYILVNVIVDVLQAVADPRIEL